MNSDFVFSSSKGVDGLEFILKTTNPNEIFRVFKFESTEDFENFIKKYNLLNDCVIIDGCKILIAQTGQLPEFNKLPILGHNIKPSTKNIFPNLKRFYEEERIKGNETRLKKFVR